MAILVLGLVIFLGLHSIRIVVPQWRERQLAGLGENRWKGAYSVGSLIGIGLVIWGFALAWPEAVVIYEPPLWMKHLAAVLMLFAFVLMMVFNLPPGRLKTVIPHPFLLSVKIWAFAHLLANGDSASLVLFGSFLAWAVWDRISVKRRETANPPVLPTPGPLKYDIAAVVIAVVLYGLFVWKLHFWLFGVSPVVVV